MAPLPPSSSPLLPPAALSVFELARINCRERLLVPPIQWTARHVELLQCSFEEPCPAPQPDDSDFPIAEYRYKNVKSFWKHREYPWREGMMEGILADPECPLKRRTGLNFHFNRRLVSSLPCLVFHIRGDKPVRGPVAAYIDRTHIDYLRIDYAYSHQPRRSSPPSKSLCRLRAKGLRPPVPHHDPYIVAMLIAVAVDQRNSHKHPKECLDPPSTFLARVLLTDINDEENIHLFTADITSSFLDKLDSPSVRPPPSMTPAIVIRHTLVPYRPFKTLRKRLLLLLLPSLRDYECEAVHRHLHKAREISYADAGKRQNEGDVRLEKLNL